MKKIRIKIKIAGLIIRKNMTNNLFNNIIDIHNF